MPLIVDELQSTTNNLSSNLQFSRLPGLIMSLTLTYVIFWIFYRELCGAFPTNWEWDSQCGSILQGFSNPRQSIQAEGWYSRGSRRSRTCSCLWRRIGERKDRSVSLISICILFNDYQQFLKTAWWIEFILFTRVYLFIRLSCTFFQTVNIGSIIRKENGRFKSISTKH